MLRARCVVAAIRLTRQRPYVEPSDSNLRLKYLELDDGMNQGLFHGHSKGI